MCICICSTTIYEQCVRMLSCAWRKQFVWLINLHGYCSRRYTIYNDLRTLPALLLQGKWILIGTIATTLLIWYSMPSIRRGPSLSWYDFILGLSLTMCVCVRVLVLPFLIYTYTSIYSGRSRCCWEFVDKINFSYHDCYGNWTKNICFSPIVYKLRYFCKLRNSVLVDIYDGI